MTIEKDRPLWSSRADRVRPTLKEKVGNRKKRWTLDKQDRPKNFPTDHDILWIAAHPLGEIAGYVAWFEQRNNLKGG